MLTELQKRKIARFFHIYDVDGSGVITQDEPERVLRTLAYMRKLDEGSAKFDAFREGFLVYWHDLAADIDVDKDGEITLSEWLNYHDRLLQDDEKFKRTVLVSGKFMFELMDANGDGEISLDEYRLWMHGLGLRDELIVKQVFEKIDLNGNGVISMMEMFELITEYYYSDDPEAPGSWAMGPIQ